MSFFRHDDELWGILNLLKPCLSNLTEFSIGCLEDLSYYVEDIIKDLTPNKVTHLGLASVKDDPIKYQPSLFDPTIMRLFVNLKVCMPNIQNLDMYSHYSNIVKFFYF